MNYISYAVVSIFSLQAFLMLFDEFYFHRNRHVPRFERIGHPLDTLSVLLCFCVIAFLQFNLKSILIYLFLSIVSCLLIIKDEGIHKKYAPITEQHLHALLFILHPVILFTLFLCWPSVQSSTYSIFSTQSDILKQIFYIQFCMTFGFLIYQVVYWNFLKEGIDIEQSEVTKPSQ